MPLETASWTDVSNFAIANGALEVTIGGTITGLSDASQFVGHTGPAAILLNSIIMKKNGLHLEIIIDAKGTIGSGDAAHINDVMVESALTSIIDLEDLIAVDAEDKVLAYRNWHQIMRGTLLQSSIKMVK